MRGEYLTEPGVMRRTAIVVVAAALSLGFGAAALKGSKSEPAKDQPLDCVETLPDGKTQPCKVIPRGRASQYVPGHP